MKFEKLNEYKLKITISNQELPNSNGDLDSFMSDPSLARKSIIDLINKAEDEVGFHVGDNKIRIDAKYLYNGDFIFTITKLIPKKKDLKKAKPKKVSPIDGTNCLIYSFNDLEHFFNFCSFLKLHKINKLNSFCKTTELYKFKNNYYLIFNDINDKYENLGKLYSSLTEFGNFYSIQDLMIVMLKERGDLIFKNNAIEVCQKNF